MQWPMAAAGKNVSVKKSVAKITRTKTVRQALTENYA